MDGIFDVSPEKQKGPGISSEGLLPTGNPQSHIPYLFHRTISLSTLLILTVDNRIGEILPVDSEIRQVTIGLRENIAELKSQRQEH